MKKQTKTIFFIVIMLGITILSCSKKDSNTITIASKNFTENIILAEMMGALIEEKTDIKVEMRSNFGSTFVVHAAIKSAEIDMYPDYTGTLYQTVLKKKAKVNAAQSFKIVKEGMMNDFKIAILEPFGFNNTYAMGFLKSKATELGLKKISDLKEHPSLIAGFDSEFIEREDGGRKMLEIYGIELENDILQLEIGLKYKAIAEKKSDFTDVFTTDSKIKRFDMTLLEDDLQFFPDYYAVPVVRQETIDKFPILKSVLAKLANSINENEAVDLNFEVEENKRDAKEVAIEFMKKKGIL